MMKVRISDVNVGNCKGLKQLVAYYIVVNGSVWLLTLLNVMETHELIHSIGKRDLSGLSSPRACVSCCMFVSVGMQQLTSGSKHALSLHLLCLLFLLLRRVHCVRC